MFWKCGKIAFENTPFSIAETRKLDCQFGPHYYKDRPQKSKSRVCLQGTRKIGCHAHIELKKCILYPEHELQEQKGGRTQKDKNMQELKSKLKEEPEAIVKKTVWFISLPTNDAHSGHPTGTATAGFSKRMNDKVAAKIVDIVASGITDKTEVRSLLQHYVVHDLCKDAQPDPNDRAYFPLDTDIANHIYMAKRVAQLSHLDQENAHLKIQEWKKTDPGSSHFFRPYVIPEEASLDRPTVSRENGDIDNVTGSFVGNNGGDDTSVIDDDNYKQPLLWVHQTDWQKDILRRYGNTLSMLDATYKTTCYELALFFVCVRTNVGYSVVAEFVVHSESAENIQEALQILKKWNPDWAPRYFMTDYSEAELNALEAVFPRVTVYLCDFHREQAWVRWARDHKHGLSVVEADNLLQLLRACAWARPGDSNDEGINYRSALNN